MSNWIDSISSETKKSASKFIEELKSGKFQKSYLPNTGEQFDLETSAKSFESFVESHKDFLLHSPNYESKQKKSE